MSVKNQLLYDKWYRQFGIRTQPHLRSPKIFNYDNFILPKQTVYHWVDYKNLFDLAPSIDEPVLKRSGNKLFTKFIREYCKPATGNFNRLGTPVDSLVLGYYNSNPNHLKPTKEIYQYNEVGYISMVGYGLLDNVYRYPKTRMSHLNKWINYHRTVFDTAREVAIKSGKQQFLELNVPRRFPTKANIDKCKEGINENNLSYVNHPDMWLVIEFWNLLGNDTSTHLFSNYTPADFKYINILWRIDNKFCCMNLGVLLSFLQASNMSNLALQRYFLKLMINLSTVREVTKEETDEEDNYDTEENEEQTPIAGIIEDEEDIYDDDDDNTFYFAGKKKSFLKAKEPLPISNQYDEVGQVNLVELEKSVDEKIIAEEEALTETEEDIADEVEEALELVAEDTSGIDMVYKPYSPGENTANEVIDAETTKLVKAGIMSIGSRDRLMKLAEDSFHLKSPFNGEETIEQSMVINPSDVIIDDNNPLPVKSLDIIDQSMTQSTINKISDKYIRNVLDKDILRMVMNLQKGGLVVKDYTTEEVEDIHNHFIIHRVQIETLKGHVSTLTFKTPKVYPDGTFISNNSKRRLRSQRRDIPLRKVAPNSVAMTSYYSKMFVNRSERMQFNLENYVASTINKYTLDKENGFESVKLNNVFNSQSGMPRQFTVLSKTFSSITKDGLTFHFDTSKTYENFKGRPKTQEFYPLAVDKDGNTALMIGLRGNRENQVLDTSGKPIGYSLFEYLHLTGDKLPNEYAEVNIFGKKIPLIFILGYHLGFGNLLKTLKLNPRREARGTRYKLEKDEYEIRFSDESLIFNRRKDSPQSLLVINGLLRVKNLLKSISVYDLDGKTIYSDFIDATNLPIKMLKESKDMFNLWVDPITESLLKEMKEPTDLVLLFLRACEMLVTDEHPDAMDTLYMRDARYERIPGIIYGELTKVVREYNGKPIYNNSKISINPEVIWFAITTDQSQQLVEESNPIHNLKEKEIVIYSGYGGRSGQTMMASARKFHKNSIGTTAENTVDSGDAGVIMYTTANPSYTSVYGLSKKQDIKTLENGRTFSTSFLLAPGANMDDGKRTNFISSQSSQGTFCEGYTPMPLRTGMEKTLHTKTGGTFSAIASQDGKVIKLTKDVLVVGYKDGTTEGFKIGRIFGKWGKYNIPHDLVANVKVGEEFKEGDCLYYNKHYFYNDITDNDNVTFKNAALARVAFIENFDTYEDSCAISKKWSEKLYSKLGHVRNVRITTDKTLKNLVNVGDSLETDSLLCTIHSVQLGSSIFNESSLKSLETIAALNPKSGVKGVVDEIRIIYTAELDEMSEEVREIVEDYDSNLYKTNKTLGSKIKSGKVNPGFLVDGVALESNEIVIQFYITELADMSVADKIVVGNQLKATVSRYWNDSVTTEDGQELDLLFSAQSVDNRIVLAADLIGTTNSLLVALSDLVVKAYEK